MVSLVGSTSWVGNDGVLSWPGGGQPGDVAVIVAFGPAWHNGPAGFTRQGEVKQQGSRGHEIAIYQVFTKRLTAGFDAAPPWERLQGFRQVALALFRDTSGVGRVRANDGRVPVRAYGAGIILASPPSASASLPSGVAWSSVATERGFQDRRGPYFGAWGWAESATDGTVGSALDWPSIGVELLPPKGPGRAVLVRPEGGEVSSAGPVDVVWQHRPSVPGGYQDRAQLERESDDGGTERWNGSEWTSGGGTLYTSESSLTVPGSSFETGEPYLLSVRTREGLDGQWSDWSTPVEVMAVTPPSVTVTAPSGAVANDLSPLVEWTATTPRGVQIAFRVRVVTALGAAVYDSGWRQGAAEGFTVPSQDWANGGAYQVLVQVQQTGGSTSDYGSSDFTMSWSTPSVPEVSADPGRDGVAVAVAADGGSLVELERIRPNGTWAPVAAFTASASPDGLVDVFAPYGQSTAWRARAATVLEGAPRWSEWGMSDPVTPVHKLSYLASAVDPARTWQPLLIVDDSEHTRQIPTAVAYGLGDDRPRVTRGVYRGRSGSLVLTAGHDDEQELDNLIALLESSEPLILRWPAEGAGDSIIDAGTLTFSVADSLATTRRAQVAVLRGRRISVSWVEQDSPGLGDTNAPITHPIEGV